MGWRYQPRTKSPKPHKSLIVILWSARNIAAVSSADVLVTIHGSGSNNLLFMDEGSTLIEVRPYQFGTSSQEWANTFMPRVRSPSLEWSTYLGSRRICAMECISICHDSWAAEHPCQSELHLILAISDTVVLTLLVQSVHLLCVSPWCEHLCCQF